MRQVFGWLGSCPETKRIYSSYDMFPHPLLQMSTSHIVVKHRAVCVGIIIISDTLLSLHLWRCIFYAKNHSVISGFTA